MTPPLRRSSFLRLVLFFSPFSYISFLPSNPLTFFVTHSANLAYVADIGGLRFFASRDVSDPCVSSLALVPPFSFPPPSLPSSPPPLSFTNNHFPQYYLRWGTSRRPPSLRHSGYSTCRRGLRPRPSRPSRFSRPRRTPHRLQSQRITLPELPLLLRVVRFLSSSSAFFLSSIALLTLRIADPLFLTQARQDGRRRQAR